jgi:hypothetical protein
MTPAILSGLESAYIRLEIILEPLIVRVVCA